MNQLDLFKPDERCTHPYGPRCGPLDMDHPGKTGDRTPGAPETWTCRRCGETWNLPSLGSILAMESPET